MAPSDDHVTWPERHGLHIANPAGLLDLPLELRTEIYSYLLPHVKCDWRSRDQPTESHLPKTRQDRNEVGTPDNDCHASQVKLSQLRTTTTFLRTCQQIYHETGTPVGLGKCITPQFSAFGHIRNLDIFIRTSSQEWMVCDAQGYVADLTRRLGASNRLQSLNVVFQVVMQHNSDIPEKRHLKKELSQYSTGQITRQHIAAFVLDPFRNFRTSEGTKISICCQYFDLSAFKQIPEVITADFSTEATTSDYNPFQSYIEADLEGDARRNEIENRTTTAFMRTSRRIYREAAEYLYRHGEFGVRLNCHHYTMLGKHTDVRSDTMPYFGAFEFIKKLDVDIFTYGDVQDITRSQSQVSRLSTWCRGSSTLRQVRIFLNVFMPGDGDRDIDKRLMKTELFYHSTRFFLRQHAAAFLLDPLRNLRLSTGGQVSINCGYFKLSAFKGIPKLLASACLMAGPTTEHESIAAYVDAIDNLRQVLESYCKERSLDDDFLIREAHAKTEILTTLIRGDVLAFSARHDKFVAQVLVLLNAPMQFHKDRRKDDKPPQPKSLTIEEATGFGRALARLAETRPKNSTLNSSGAVYVENAITRWQAAHKLKFMAHRRKMRAMKVDRASKRIKLDGDAQSTWGNDASAGSESAISDDEEAYAEYPDNDYCFMENEGEDSDGLSWCAEDSPWYRWY